MKILRPQILIIAPGFNTLLKSILVVFSLLLMSFITPVSAQESWSQNWIQMVGSDWNYMTDPSGDHNPASIDVVNNGVPLCSYYASSSSSIFYRMALRGDPLNNKGELDQYAWMAQIDVADDGNSDIDVTVRAEGITEYISTYNGSGTQLWTVADPISAGYVRSYQSGSIWYLEMQAPYSALGGITRDTPVRFFFHTSTTETNAIKDATVPSTTISGAFAESGTTTMGGSGGYGFMYDSRDTNPYTNAGSYDSGETVNLQGYGWPGSTTLNVRIKNSGGTIVWSGTVSSNSSGTVASTAGWTVDYSAASGLYTIAVQSPINGAYYDYDRFTVVQLMEPEINVTGNSQTIADGDVSPSVSDATDFGTIDLNTGIRDHIFTIQNIGNTSLTLSGSPVVNISGTNPGDFTVTQQASSPVASGNSVTFTVQFNPSALGLRSATVSIANDDSNENPYDFAIQGTGALLPEMDVSGNGISIADGDNTPNSTDETLFGTVPTDGVTQVHTFRIDNYGSADLSLSGSPVVSIGGTHASDFTVTTLPATIVTAGSYTTFVITFNPSAIGTRSASVSIANNDLDENPYNFSIEGEGVGNGTPFSCTSRFYHFYGSGSFAYLNTGSNPFTYSTFGSAGYAINAAGYNQEDGLMYANTGSDIIRIDGNGVVTVLSVTNPFASNAGDCDNSGNYYFVNTGGTQLAKYDVSTAAMTTSSLSGTFSAQDMAYISGSFWGVNGTTLYQLNPSGGSVSSTAITGSLANDSGLNGSSWSAAWTAGGYLYVVNESSHRFYKIDTAAGLSFYSGTGSGSLSSSDGASCHSASSPMPSNGATGNFVWHDYNNDGIQDVGEPGLSGVTVTLYRRGGTQIANTTSSSAGTYSFTGISPEQYYLTFSSLPSGYSLGMQDQGGNDNTDSDPNASTGQTAGFIIDAYETVNTWDAACVATGVGNFVWNDLDEDGIQDAGEPGVANVTVTLQLGNGTDVATATTNADGNYQFTGLTAGTQYQLMFTSLPGGFDFTSKDQGSDDTIDSDANPSTTKTGKFSPAANVFDQTWDAGIIQTSFPEIEVKGNDTDITDGDLTPGVSDDTEFGEVLVSAGSSSRTFTILNTGAADLTISISISGTHSGDFSVISAPSGTVPSGDSTTFTIRFDPSGGGMRSAVINVINNDADENPFDFAVQGTGLAPEIDVLGNSQSINDGDSSPSTADHTDFGAADINTGSITRTFTIANTGTYHLDLDGVPMVELSGTHSSDFSITQQPAANNISAGSSLTFQVTFDPSAVGLRSAEISIPSTDADEDPYHFSIQGTGTTGPEMDVKGNGVSIASGDVTPSTADDTNYGTVNINVGSVIRTFTIYNFGNTDLSLTGTPIVSLSGGSGFSVTTQPASSTVGSGGSVTFAITFNPSSVGAQTASVSIANNDSNENPYTFTVGGEGIVEPEMDILGNGIEITNGDVTPVSADGTDWSTVDIAADAVYHTFTILNEGNANLLLTGTPYVSISGSADFTISTQPASGTVGSSGGTQTFVVSFDPGSIGLKTATISIDNNDPDEHPYTFTVQGEGATIPEITLAQSGTDIPDGGTYTFANTEIGSYTEITFTISNIGSVDLTMTTPYTLSGVDAGQFSIESQPGSSTLGSGGSTTFTVRFTPTSAGAKSAEIVFANNDSDENPFNLNLTGTGTVAEMTVLGNGNEITDGDAAPDTADDTDFGDVVIGSGSVNHTFTIRNDGTAILQLTGTPIVAISGSGDFSVTAQPAGTSIAAGHSLTFTVRFNPSSAGLKSAAISISNSDSDENPYNYNIQGIGTAPEMAVSGNSTEITNGDGSPSTSDDTDFGHITVSGGDVDHTFTITNSGTSVLNLTGTPIVAISGSSDFSIHTQPSGASVASGGGTVTFIVRFNPTSSGLKSATVSIANNDSNENPYTFAVQGTGDPDPIPVLVLSKSVDKASAVPGEELTYTITYENIGGADATSVVILEPIPANVTFVQGSVTASGMTVIYSHDGGSGYDGSDTAPVTHIKFQRAAALTAGSSGSITFKVEID